MLCPLHGLLWISDYVSTSARPWQHVGSAVGEGQARIVNCAQVSTTISRDLHSVQAVLHGRWQAVGLPATIHVFSALNNHVFSALNNHVFSALNNHVFSALNKHVFSALNNHVFSALNNQSLPNVVNTEHPNVDMLQVNTCWSCQLVRTLRKNTLYLYSGLNWETRRLQGTWLLVPGVWLGGGSGDEFTSRNRKFEKSLWENGPFVGHSRGRQDNVNTGWGGGEEVAISAADSHHWKHNRNTHTHTYTHLTLCILIGPFRLRLLFDLTDGSLQRNMWVCGLTDRPTETLGRVG